MVSLCGLEGLGVEGLQEIVWASCSEFSAIFDRFCFVVQPFGCLWAYTISVVPELEGSKLRAYSG